MAARVRRDGARPGRELTAWSAGHLCLLVLLSATTGLGPVGWLAATGYATTLWAVLATALHRSRAPSLGPANRVTLARAILVGGVAALVADSIEHAPPTAVLVALATTALLLDAVDGQVARRTGTASPLGARFDMEIDAFLILVLSVFVASSLGAWVLAIGAMRYAFVAAYRLIPWLRAPLRSNLARKAVAAFQGITLTTASAAILPRPLTTGIVALALASLAWSFGRDIRSLWRQKSLHPTT